MQGLGRGWVPLFGRCEAVRRTLASLSARLATARRIVRTRKIPLIIAFVY